MSDDSTAQADPFADYGIRSAFTLLYEAAAELTMAFQVIHRKGGRPAAEGQKQSLARLTVLLKEIRRGDRGEDAKRLAELVRSWDTRPTRKRTEMSQTRAYETIANNNGPSIADIERPSWLDDYPEPVGNVTIWSGKGEDIAVRHGRADYQPQPGERVVRKVHQILDSYGD